MIVGGSGHEESQLKLKQRVLKLKHQYGNGRNARNLPVFENPNPNFELQTIK